MKIYFINSASLFSSSLPRRFFAMIFPFLSSRKLFGIAVTVYSAAVGPPYPFRSQTFPQVYPSWRIAFFQAVVFLSMETLNIVNPLSLYALYSLTNVGLSSRQGGHHEAQNSTNVYLPRYAARSTFLPAVSVETKPGATAPIAIRLVAL